MKGLRLVTRTVYVKSCDGCGKEDDGTFEYCRFESGEFCSWAADLCGACRQPIAAVFRRGTDLVERNSLRSLHRAASELENQPS